MSLIIAYVCASVYSCAPLSYFCSQERVEKCSRISENREKEKERVKCLCTTRRDVNSVPLLGFISLFPFYFQTSSSYYIAMFILIDMYVYSMIDWDRLHLSLTAYRFSLQTVNIYFQLFTNCRHNYFHWFRSF